MLAPGFFAAARRRPSGGTPDQRYIGARIRITECQFVQIPQIAEIEFSHQGVVFPPLSAVSNSTAPGSSASNAIDGNPATAWISNGLTASSGAHAYWRLRTADDSTRGYFTVGELEFRATAGGPDQCEGGTAFASSTYASTNAEDAFDGDQYDEWSTNFSDNTSGDGSFIGYQFADPVAVQEIAYTSHTLVSEALQAGTVEWSDDGVAWTTAWSIPLADPPFGQYETRVFTDPSVGAGASVEPAIGVLFATPTPNLDSVSITVRSTDEAPQTFVLEATYDGENWFDLWTINAIPTWFEGETRTFSDPGSIEEPTSAQPVPIWASPSLVGGGGTFFTDNAVRYVNLFSQPNAYVNFSTVWNTTEGDWRDEIGEAGAFYGFAVYISTNARTSPTRFTVMVNGEATPLRCTVAPGATGWINFDEDTGGATDEYYVGDLVSVRMETGPGGGLITFDNFETAFNGSYGSVNHLKSVGDYGFASPYSTAKVMTAAHGTAEYNSFVSGWADAPAEGVIGKAANIIATPGYLYQMRVHVPQNTATGPTRIELHKNGAPSGVFVEVPAGETGVFYDVDHGVDVVYGDCIEWRRWGTTSGSGSTTFGNIQITLSTQSDYDLMISQRAAATYQNYANDDWFMSPGVFEPKLTQENEYNRHRTPLDATVTDIIVLARHSTGGADWAVELLKNGEPTGAVVNVKPESGTSFSSQEVSVPITQYDKLLYKFRCGAFDEAPCSITLKIAAPS